MAPISRGVGKYEKTTKINKKLTKHSMRYILGRWVRSHMRQVFYLLVSMETDHVTINKL